MMPEDFGLDLDPFDRRHVGPHGAFIQRTNRAHAGLARAAVAHRLDVPVGSIEIDWGAVREKKPALHVVPARKAAA